MTEKTRERSPGPALPGTVALRRPVWLPSAGVAAVAAAGLILFMVSLRGVHLGAMNGLGLISVLPAGSLAGALLLAVAFIAALGLDNPRPVLLGGILAAIVICLDGVTAIVEAEPRFPTAYQIAGFVDYISRTGHSAPGLEAYFSWPGFFALVAFLEGVAGKHDLMPVLRLWPVAIDLLCLPPLFLIMRNLRASWRARWLAGFLFTAGNWVGQDYFSPQAFNFFLYLVFIALLVNWFTDPAQPPRSRPGGPGWLARLHRRAFGVCEPGELGPRPASTGQRVSLLLLLIVICVVSTTSHQLTPAYLLVATAGLVLVRRCELRGLPVLIGVILVGWVSFATAAYWSGHMANIFGGLGRLGANVSTSIGGRMVGSSPVHLQVLHARVAIAALVVGLALLGLLRRRFRHIDDRVVLVLLCAPLLSIGVQSYGGEIALRIYLFLLPATSILGAYLFFPDPDPLAARRLRWVFPAATGCAVVLVLGFFLVRYGNEAFEETPSGEISAMDYIYAHDARGLRLEWLSEAPAVDVTPQMPWGYQDDEKISYVPVKAPPNPADTSGLVRAIRNFGPTTYLITTTTQESYLEQGVGYPTDWGRLFRAAMTAAPGVRVVFASPSAVIYTLRWPPGTIAHPPVADIAGPHFPSSPLTPVGLTALGLLVLVLTGRELLRICIPGTSRLLRPLTWTALPLLLLLVGVVAARFVELS